ncbi:MAG: D-alanyl-D-alanine carboxypeptidase, partial [Thermoleophilaceae bacterium]
LPVAGRDGTLRVRMRSGAARGRCRGKTGTLSNVSALSGYCTARSGELYAFSILMTGVYTPGARRLQDRMAQAIARQR